MITWKSLIYILCIASAYAIPIQKPTEFNSEQPIYDYVVCFYMMD